MDDASLDEATGLPHWQPVKADESVDVAAAESEVQNVNGNVSHAVRLSNRGCISY